MSKEQERKEYGKKEIFPDGWGMAIDPEANVTPEESFEIIKGVIKQEKGEKTDA